MKAKRFFGIPGVVLAVVLAVVLTGSAVMAAFFFTRSQPAQVVIRGGGVVMFQDAACTVPLGAAETLDFGEVRLETPTGVISFYLKNVGTDTLFPTIATDINANLNLYESTFGLIEASPVDLWIPESYTWIVGVEHTTIDLAGVDATATRLAVTGWAEIVPAYPLPWIMKIENEIIKINSYEVGSQSLTGLERGYANTTPAAHAAGSVVNFGTVSFNSADYLDPGEVRQVALHIEAAGDLTAYLGTTEPFSVVIEVNSDY